jgi:hypothetical protein
MFELFWLKLEGFEEADSEGWKCDNAIIDPYVRLDNLFINLEKYLHAWGERRRGNVKLQIAMANMVILRFDMARSPDCYQNKKGGSIAH